MRAKETACNVTSELGIIIKGDAKKLFKPGGFFKELPEQCVVRNFVLRGSIRVFKLVVFLQNSTKREVLIGSLLYHYIFSLD
jgi:hypothetical protein